jgi:3-hydroxybutyryl-CoA dehydrogenase
MGPLRTADLVGLDVTLALLQSLWDHTGDERFRVPAVLVEMVKSGKLGRKSGEGFYKYED